MSYATAQALSTASTTSFSALELEQIMPDIYLTKNFLGWNEANLRAHGFSHIIIIDKHIQELYYPAPVFKLASSDSSNRNNNCLTTTNKEAFCDEAYSTTTLKSSISGLQFDKDFTVIDLNFGEKSYLTTVLPNCYRAVKFINKALEANGHILVIDCNGGEQKCVTIIVAYLMYKHNINFSNAFNRLKEFYAKADLDRFYMNQLYEYEPILQVQRAQARGHSCSRKLHAAVLKRKRQRADMSSHSSSLLDTFNPLSHFNTNVNDTLQQHQQQQQLLEKPEALQMQNAIYTNNSMCSDTSVMTTRTMTTTPNNLYNYLNSHAWDDFTME